MASLGNLSVNLELLIADFASSAKSAAEQSAKLAESISENFDLAKEAVIGFAEVMAFDWFKEKVNQSLEYAESIAKVSEATGVATDFVQKWNYAAGQSGVSVEASNAALQRFAKSLGSTDNQQLLKLFKDLGVTSTDTKTALLQFSDGLSKVQDKTKQVADVTQAFGRTAMNLVPVLAEGSDGLTELGKDAESLGIVMSNSLIEQSVEAEHKLTALKEVLGAEMASTIAQNATAIVGLAQAMEQLTSATIGFFGAHPELALTIIGGLAGARVGGVYGAAAGALGGFALGHQVQQDEDDSNMDLGFRRQQWLDAQQSLNGAVSAGKNQSFAPTLGNEDGVHTLDVGAAHDAALQANTSAILTAKQQYDKQAGLWAKAVAAGKEKPDGVVTGHTLPQPKGPRTHGHDHSAQQEAAFDKALQTAQLQNISLHEQFTSDPQTKAMLQHQSLDLEYGAVNSNAKSGNGIDGGSLDKQIDDQYAEGKYGAVDSDIAKQRRDELKKQTDANGLLQQHLVNIQEDNALDQQDLAIASQQYDNQKTMLGYQLDLATTAEERRKVQQQILDIEYQQKDAALKAKLAADQRMNAAPSVVKQDTANITANDAAHVQATAVNNQQNAGPLASYLKAIPSTAQEANEALQNVAVDGLGKLTDGLAGVITGTESVGKAFKDMASSIIADIAKIAIEEAIIKPLGKALGSAIGGLKLGGLVGHANGGLAQPGTYLVGERGPEIETVGQDANIVPTSALNSMTKGGGGNMTINSTVSGVNDPAAVRALSAQTIMQALPATLRMSSDNTVKRLSYPKMR